MGLILNYSIPKNILDKAIQHYEDFGVVTEKMVDLGRAATRKLFVIMQESGCEEIEDAVIAEHVTYKDGNRDEYYTVIYNRNRFSNTDEVNDFLLETKLHVSG